VRWWARVGLFSIGLVALGACSSSHPHRQTLPSTVPSTTAASAPTTTTPVTAVASGPCAQPVVDDTNDGVQPGWIQMVSDRRGFAAVGNTVLATRDGQRWDPIENTTFQLRFLDATDRDHVWIVTRSSLVLTSDGGKNWRAVGLPAEPLTTVHFIDARTGWAIAGGRLFRSDDGGEHWRRVNAPCALDQVCFDRAMHGWLAGGNRVYRTDDAGATWSLVLRVPDWDPEAGVADLQCAHDHSAWMLFGGSGAASGNQNYVAYRCPSDGGCRGVVRQLYFPTPAVTSLQGPGSYPGPFSIIDSHTAVFVGYTPAFDQPVTMMFARDTGSHSARFRVPVATHPQAAAALATSFRSTRLGWIVVDNGRTPEIVATRDGGHTWTVQYRRSPV
jgi:hypothetical protein